MAVRKAVSAATTTFTATSMILFFITLHFSLFTIHYSLAKRLTLIQVVTSVASIATVTAATATLRTAALALTSA